MKTIPEEDRRENGHLFNVPGDMLMDVLNVLVNNQIRCEIQSVKMETSCAQVRIEPSGNDTYTYRQAVKNVEAMLDEYADYQKFLQPQS